MRLRILLGSLLLVVGLLLYAAAIASLVARLAPEGWVLQALLYGIGGIAWLPVAARLTRWMQQAAPFRPPGVD